MFTSGLTHRRALRGNTTSKCCSVLTDLLLLAAMPIIFSPATLANEISIYGPQIFERAKGKPSKESIEVFAPEAGDGYFLRVNNDVEGYKPVGSAKIYLNGKLIIAPKDLSKRSPGVERKVSLNTTNELAVDVKGHPDGALIVEIVSVDSAGPKDDDGDGVSNESDHCPGTTAGAAVDTNGCAESQLDDDADGVTNDVDHCPGTSPDEAADESGCAPSQLDDDNDGIYNDLDQCPGTPAGADVNDSGCAESQLDDDGDGVENALDQCPNTAPGNDVDSSGCAIDPPDDDGDGVGDHLDQCPGTPPGEFVDASGCAPSQLDDDSDGVTNDVDQCSGTPAGDAVDTDGCAASQLDTDNDGITNDIDQCPGTPAGAAVDSFGCEIDSGSLPPDPASVANPLDPAVITGFKEAIEFLYTADNPVQTGVIAASISEERAAVVRGSITDRDGNPLSGVTVSIHKHPEFGQTLSRSDGLFDLAVDGGRRLVVNYEKAGYLPVQRGLEVPQRDYATLDRVVMISLDTQVSTIDLSDSSKEFQIARGSVQSDSDGSRQVTVLFPQGTEAVMTLPDGSTQSLTTLNVRGTEYTVGDRGPETMPGELPPSSGYTYAVELSVDEAIAAGATRIDFSQPVAMYVDNFVSFPTGISVPMGWYDRESAVWRASDNGRVIEILSVENGLAAVDVDGSGSAADAATLEILGITESERRQLAALYSAGKSLWRSEITHFTPWDCNWPYALPDDAEPPKQSEPDIDETEDEPCEQNGSIIECQNAVLKERISIAGTSSNLNYRSDLVPGRKAYADIPVTGDSISPSLLYIDLKIGIAGRLYSYRLPAQSNLTHRFVWDGKDAYGRRVVGKQRISISIGYVYPLVYTTPDQFQQAFGRAGGAPLSASRGSLLATIWQRWSLQLQGAAPAGSQLGGWLITPQHHYDPRDDKLILGDGSVQVRQGDGGIISTVAGSGESSASGDGGLATDAGLQSPYDVASAPDGGFYILNWGDQTVRYVDSGGVISSPESSLPSYSQPESLAVGIDGSLYIADTGNNRVLRLARDGSISTFAGTGESGFSGDGGRADEATLRAPTGLAVAHDGSLYIADRFNNRIRRVGVDGIINTVAGDGQRGFGGDGGLATNASLNLPYDVAFARDGSLYISDTLNDRIRKVGVDGRISTVAGSGFRSFGGDGGLATSAALNIPTGVAVSNNGRVYFADYGNQRIRRIGSDGIIHTIAGDGLSGFGGDSGPATKASLAYPRGVAIASDGSLLVADSGNHRIRQIVIQNPDSIGEVAIPSESGDLLYHFDRGGRHRKTVNAVTGGLIYGFHYDDGQRLVRIEDGEGNITQIERDFEGNPTTIVAPDGQRTVLSVNSNGYISTVTNPAGEMHSMVYTANGLLTGFTDPRGNNSSMSYDELGRLKSDFDAEGGGWSLERVRLPSGAEYRMTSAEDRLYRYLVEQTASGGRLRTNIGPDGTVSSTRFSDNGEIINSWADGTEILTQEGPDPRFGMAAPIPETVTTTTPGGLVRTVTTGRSAELADSDDLLSHAALSETISINARTRTAQYDAATRTWVSTSAEGRSVTTELNATGLPLSKQLSGLVPLGYSYDSRGRLAEIVIGSGSDARLTQFSYDSEGNLASVTDPLLRTSSFDYDLAGRITRQSFPDGRSVDYEYDSAGNLSAIIPPGREAHIFSYNRVNLEDAYAPPDLPGVQTITRYEYNLDRQLTRIIRPDGRELTYSYDAGGRLSQLEIQRGQFAYSYHNTTGQLQAITAPGGGQLTYSYDGFLPLSEVWSGAVAGSVSRSYDNNFWMTERCVNGSSCVSFSYDGDGLLIGAGALGVSRHAQHGLITETSLGDVRTSSSYNSFGEILGYESLVAGNRVLNIGYQRDALGRITTRSEVVAGVAINESYEYDSAGRLVAVTKNGETTSWQYDNNGNRTHENGVQVATYDEQDRLLTYGDASYSYTANGELATKARNGAVTHYQYDELGSLIAVRLPGDINIDYLIDGQNRRVGKKVNGELVQGFLYADQLNPVAELDGNGSIVARFIYADKTNVPAYMIKDGVTYRIISDHLGSPRLVINTGNGEIAQRMEYDAWGNVVSDTNPGFQPFGFAGGIYDSHTELVRFGVRDYDPEVGRWTAKDPIRFGGRDSNLYAYVYNSPRIFTDPLGLISFSVDAYAGVGGGITIGYNESTGNFFGGGRVGFGVGGGLNLDLLDKGPEVKSCDSGTKLGTFGELGASFGPYGVGYGFEGGRYTSGGDFSNGPSLDATVNGLGGKGFSFGGAVGVQAIGY